MRDQLDYPFFSYLTSRVSHREDGMERKENNSGMLSTFKGQGKGDIVTIRSLLDRDVAFAQLELSVKGYHLSWSRTDGKEVN